MRTLTIAAAIVATAICAAAAGAWAATSWRPAPSTVCPVTPPNTATGARLMRAQQRAIEVVAASLNVGDAAR